MVLAQLPPARRRRDRRRWRPPARPPFSGWPYRSKEGARPAARRPAVSPNEQRPASDPSSGWNVTTDPGPRFRPLDRSGGNRSDAFDRRPLTQVGEPEHADEQDRGSAHHRPPARVDRLQAAVHLLLEAAPGGGGGRQRNPARPHQAPVDSLSPGRRPGQPGKALVE